MASQINARRVGIVVSVLPQDEARQVLMSLTPAQATEVLHEINAIRDMSLAERLPVLTDFVQEQLNRSHREPEVSHDLHEALRQLRYDRPGADPPFTFLHSVAPERIAQELDKESPHGAAVVLAHLPTGIASRVIESLPATSRANVVQHLAELGPTQRSTIRQLEETLEVRLSDCVAGCTSGLGGVHFVAEVLREAAPDTGNSVIRTLRRDDPTLSDEIDRTIDQFERLSSASDRDLRILVRHIEPQQWAVALLGTEPEFRETILRAMEQPVAASVRQQMEWLGPLRGKTINAMRDKISKTIRQLRTARIIMCRDRHPTRSDHSVNT